MTMTPIQQATGSSRVHFRSPAEATEGLVHRLFQGPERWGWEYVEPRPPAPHPHLDQYPQWVEPMLPDVSGLQWNLQQSRERMPKLATVAALVCLLGLATLANGTGVVILLAGLALAAFAVHGGHSARSEIDRVLAAADARREQQYGQYLADRRSWDERIAQHDAAERRRHATDPLLYPVAPSEHAGRVDVVGGTPVGWASLLATTGGSLIAEGAALLVVDLTGDDVTGPLRALATVTGERSRMVSVPAGLEAPWLLGDLPPRDLADVLAQAMDALRGQGVSADLTALDAEIIHSVAGRLDGPMSFARLAAGVGVLRSTYDHDEDAVLSAAEVARLTERVDLVDRSERVRDELRFVETQLSLLADGPRQGTVDAPGSLWPDGGLAVLRSDEPNPRRKGFIDQVLFQAVVHRLLNRASTPANAVLVVAGADDLGRASLETAARHAYKAGVRLVYVFEHFRDAAAELIGGGDSVAVVMRLGNGREAANAADLIGRAHTFQVSQLSRQVGRNSSATVNSSRTTTRGRSETTTSGGSSSRSFGRGGPGGSSGESWSQGVTDSWSSAHTTGESFSEGGSESDGVTVQRSYDFTVEPQQIQSLDPTAFLIVDGNGATRRRVRMADCFPGSVFVPRLSPRAR